MIVDDRPAASLQLTWARDGLLAWLPAQSRVGANIPASLARSFHGGLPWSHTTIGHLRVPTGDLQVIGQHIAPEAFVTLGEVASTASPSMRWFGALREHAVGLVRAGRVLPRLEQRDQRHWLASWRPLDTDRAAIVAAMGPSMPPVCAAALVVEVPKAPDHGALLAGIVLDRFVDVAARSVLRAVGWRADVGTVRQAWASAARSVGKALAGDAEFGMAGSEALEPHLAVAATAFERMQARIAGGPIVRTRLRLALPDDVGGDWPVTLELVDSDDSSRWCTIADVAGGTPAALQLAGGPERLADLSVAADLGAGRLATVLPEVVDALAELDASIELEQAALVLERYDAVRAAGVELLVPEQLARRRPQVRATATPKTEGAGRFGAEALLDWNVVVDDEAVDEATLRRAAELGTSLIEVGGRWVRLEGNDVRRALVAVSEHRQRHGTVGTIGLLQLAAELEEEAAAAAADAVPDAPTAPTITGSGWLGELLAGLPDTSLTDGDVPPAFAATLRPYQLRGLGWLQFLRRLGLGGCLADDMGLGKTPTTLAHLAGIDGPHLVLCPLSVVRNWQQEAARFVPMARLLVLHGTVRPRGDALRRAVAAADIVVTTYHSATRDIDALVEVDWSTVVLDEAQAVKNPHTHAAKAVRRLRAGQRIALTGTPVENRLGELWAILDVVAPGLLGSEAHFRSHFALPIERHRDDAAAAALRRLTSPFLLRRTKADKSLVPDLPDKVEQIAWASLTREQAAMYQAVVDQLLVDAEQASGMRRRGLVLAALTRLKQICNHPAHALGDGSRLGGRSGKLARFDELVADLLDAGEQALVFTQYRVMGELLARHLQERFQLHAPFLHGGVARRGRDRMVEEFQLAEGSPLLIVSLKAGGTGLNLTAASRVVHYDRWWNPAVEDQATDRAWRIGQTQSVFVHKLVCQGTIEERVAQLIDDKRALADSVVGPGGEGESWLSEMSTDELRGLVTLDRHAVTS
ncbi:MAG: hypothetical protein JWM12_871 [Ilumatobacteraceae bacterium]|nr:hypothetical protein [Ilumatobacteraceae bacterium]